MIGLSACIVSAAFGQGVRLQIGDDILVSEGPPGMQLIEPHLAAHPSRQNQLLAVGWAYPEGLDERRPRDEYCVVFRSTDGGATWSEHSLDNVACADPWIAMTEDRATLTMMGTAASLTDTLDAGGQLIAFFSADGGTKWNPNPQGMGANHDGPRTTVARDGTIYLTSGQAWTYGTDRELRFSVFVGRARSDERHFYTVGRLHPSSLNLNADGLAVLSDGTLVITYSDFQRKVEGRGFRSRAGALEKRRTWAIRSEDAGETYSLPLMVTEDCYSRPTFLAVDTSSTSYRDRLYHVCPGEDLKSILLMYSSDRAEEWTVGTAIEAPAAEAGSRREPQIAVNSHGVVVVAWMDRRDDPSGVCYAPYITASSDGGQTFSDPQRVASEISCPYPERVGVAGRRWPTGGDYFGLAADAAGTFHMIWPDARAGTFALRSAAISVAVTDED